MRRSVARIRGLGFILWHARHEWYHVVVGLLWAWVLRERWGEFNLRWISFSVVGSLLPDVDHFFYFISWGKHDWYTRQIRKFLKTKQWRILTVFIEKGHKYNTNLSTHNYYVMVLLLGVAIAASFVDWNAGVILFGAMLLHYLFDICDDLVTLGAINPNWKRWGRGKLPSSG